MQRSALHPLQLGRPLNWLEAGCQHRLQAGLGNAAACTAWCKASCSGRCARNNTVQAQPVGQSAQLSGRNCRQPLPRRPQAWACMQQLPCNAPVTVTLRATSSV